MYEVQPCTGTSDTVCQVCLHSSPRHFAGTDKSQVANGKDHKHLYGHHHHHRSNSINNGDGPSSSSSQQQRNLLSTLTIGDNNKNKRTTSGNLIHFLNHPVGGGPTAAITNNNNSSSTEPPTTLGSFPSGLSVIVVVEIYYRVSSSYFDRYLETIYHEDLDFIYIDESFFFIL